MALLLCLLPLVQGTIIMSISSINSSVVAPYELNEVDTQTGKTKQIVELGRVSGCSVFRPHDNTVVYCTFGSWQHWLTTVDLSTGKVRQGERSPYSFMDLEYDKRTHQTFVFALNGSLSSYHQPYLLELLPNQTLQKLGDTLPKGNIRGGSAYSSSKQIFFLNMDNLLAVSTAKGQEGKVLYSVPLVQRMRALLYDDASDVLYGWFTADRPRSFGHVKLVSLDYTTGTILKTFFEASTRTLNFLYQSFPPMCIDKTGSTIHTFLYHVESARLVIHGVEVSSGKSSHVATDHFASALFCSLISTTEATA